jgi:hypothetical protein
MTRRLLPSAEWSKLVGTELEDVWPHLDPDRSVVIVVEDEGQIIGCWSAFDVLHAEGIWIADAHRRRGHVARLLLAGMSETALTRGVQTLATSAITDDVAALAERLGGVPVPGRHFVLQVENLCRLRSRSH